MDLSIIYTKTGRGTRALVKKLPPNAGQILSVMGATSSASNIFVKLKKINERDFDLAITWLLEGGFIKIVTQQPFSDSIWAPVTQSSILVSEISFDEFNQTIEAAAAAKAKEEAETKTKLEALTKADEEARERAEAQAKAAVEAREKAEIAAKEQAELTAKEKAAAEARERAETQAKAEAAAKEHAELEAKAAIEAKAKEEAEAKAKLEALAKAESDARKKAEAQAKAEAKALARTELLAKAKTREKAEAEANEREKAGATARKQAELEAKERAQALAKAEEEARERTEEKAEAEAKAQAELDAKENAKAAARARIKAEKKAVTEAKLKALKNKLVLQTQRFTNISAPKLPALGNQIDLKKIKKAGKQKLIHASSLVKSIFKTFFKYSLFLFFIIIVAAQFINLRMFIKPIEHIASENIQETVNIQSVNASLFPSPHFILKNISIDNSATLKADTVSIFPSKSALLNQFSATPQISYEINAIEIEGLDISQQDLERPISWVKASNQLKQLKIKHILLKNTFVHLNGIELPPINGDIQLTADGQLNNASLSTEDQHLIVDVSHPDNRFLLYIKAQQWRSPISPNLVFTDLNAKGLIENNLLTLSPINGFLYNGQLKASMAVDLRANWVANGDFELSNINLAKVTDELKIESAIDGNFNANASYSFNYNNTSNQIEAPIIDTRFKVKNGNINKIDLIEAMHNNNANIGGSTHFTELTGNLLLNDQSYQFRNLTLQDNQLQANGKLDINTEKNVTGDIYSIISLKSNPIKSHLLITGTIDSLKLKK